MIAKIAFDCVLWMLAGRKKRESQNGPYIWSTHGLSASFFGLISEDWIRRNAIHCLSPDKMNIPHTSRKNFRRALTPLAPYIPIYLQKYIFLRRGHVSLSSSFTILHFQTWPGVICKGSQKLYIYIYMHGKNGCFFSILIEYSVLFCTTQFRSSRNIYIVHCNCTTNLYLLVVFLWFFQAILLSLFTCVCVSVW